MEQNQKIDISDFITSCNEFIEGKFILADIKISKILRSISTLKEIYNLIAESLINYDFEREFKKIKDSSVGKGSNHLELPLDNQQIIPLVFSMLVEIDSKKLNFDTLLSSSFPIANTQKEEYELFSKYVILPFRNAIAQIFGVDAKNYIFEEKIVEEEINIIDKKLKEIEELDLELVKKNEIDKQLEAVNAENVASKIEEEDLLEQQNSKKANDEEISLLFSRISRMCGIIESKSIGIKDTLKKSNIYLIVDALIESCAIKNKKIAVALILSLNLVAHRERVIKQELKEINNICFEFYA
ncbi:MAG: hypothetical protein EOM55_02970 [Clostridia bacterium]|nr:hypothetical protein [Clostridia bacterium]